MIDAHLHLWDLDGGPATGAYAWLGHQQGELFRSYREAEARDTLLAAGVSGAVLIQADDTTADTDAMLAAAGRNDWILGVVGWIPLDKPAEAAEELQRLVRNPRFRGVRHLVHDDPRDDFLELPEVRESLGLLARHGLAFDVPDAFPRHLGRTVQLARELPELTIVLDHLGKPPLADADYMAAWRRDFRALAGLPNTVAKLSGLHLPGVPYTAEALRPLWDEAMEAFGPERLIFGGDWPVSTLGAPYGRTLGVLLELAGELEPIERQAVLEGTARRTYAL